MKTSARPIDALIFNLRNQKVILDSDLAELYGVPTKRLSEQVKRNIDRFPEDFMFQLTEQEWDLLRSQIVTANLQQPIFKDDGRSQIATAKSKPNLRRTLPYAFTEHGAIMAATVLSSPEAVTMSVYVVRAFIQMREQIAANDSVLKRLAEIDKTLFAHDDALRALWAQLEPLLMPVKEERKSRIGFHGEAAGRQ